MTSTQRAGMLLIIGITSLSLAGCSKLFDYIKDHPDEDCTDCKITKLVVISPYDTNTAVIAYNSYDDPVSITPNWIGTGNTQRLFRYDSKHRLTDYIGAYELGGYEQWRWYVYDNNNRVIRDTSYSFGSLSDKKSGQYGPFVTTYDYDSKGRISHTSTLATWLPYPPQEFFYTYDSHGNLESSGVTYDDKINFRRTNKVWMFIDRNYSVNNSKPVIGYNDKGLPLKVGPGITGFAGFNGPWMELTYKCK